MKLGYVVLTEGQRSTPGGSTYEALILVLTQKALDYERRRRKPWPVRALLNVLDDWGKDLRAAVIAMGVAILTTVILKWLGY